MDATRWAQGFHQDIGLVKPIDQIISTNNDPTRATTGHGASPMLERKARPQEQLNCPRCNSTNTKFCYYNNYSLTQPRYFCKTCRRYWTEGGSLRNVPVGGGSRKNKKSTFSTNSNAAANTKHGSSSSALTNSKLPDLNPPVIFSNIMQNPKTQKDEDLNLSFSAMQEGQCNLSQYLHDPKIEPNSQNNTCSAASLGSCNMSALELLRTGIASRGLNTFMPETHALYSPGFSLQDYKPTLGFSMDGFDVRSSTNDAQSSSLNGNRILFPLADHQMKQFPNTTGDEGNIQDGKSHGSSGPGYWSGLLGTGGGNSW